MKAAEAVKPERRAYYDRIDAYNMAPLWEVLHGLVTPEPVSPVKPALWRYDEIRPYLMESGRIISAKEAVRRVLILENPGLRGASQITRSLYAGLQLILPGEVAPVHRHTQSALRFVVEGEGAYTAVDGERTTMREGDFIITPAWTWHDHGNDGDGPMVWLDGLDIPIVQMLDASFAENGNAEQQMITRPEGDSPARYGRGVLPVDWKPGTKTSPVFSYPYSKTRGTLDTMRKAGDPDPCHGWKVRYINPATGDWAMPTIGTFLQLLPGPTEPYRSSDATVFVAVEGEGETRIGETSVAWGKRDVFIAPSWTRITHHPKGEAVLFSFSDRPVQEKLGLFREERFGR
jgi:gentisate 1,2-dioxygenase